MGKRGFPPKPTAIRLLEGNAGKVKINPDEPKPQVLESYDPPEDLTEQGKTIWRSLSTELARLQLLTVIDLESFYRYIKYLIEWREMDSKIDDKYVITIKNPDGSTKYVMQNPYLSVRNTIEKNLQRLEQQFGMTPSARARMIGLISGGVKPKEVIDPYDD